MVDLLAALQTLFTFHVFAFMATGIAAGIMAGALPGLTATMSIALLVPFTYRIDPPIAGLMVLLGVYIGAMHGGAISAILIRTPGTPAAAATCFDGYPLARKGQASLALNISAIASTTGGLLSTVVLFCVAMPIAAFALKFGPFEMFCLAVFGLSIISSISEGSVIKGFIMGALGMLFAAAGRSTIFDIDRITFGIQDLPESGLRYIPLMIGVFAITEALSQVEMKTVIERSAATLKNVFPTMRQLKQIAPALGISSILGTIVGAIPGAGGDIAGFVAYDQTKKASPRSKEFGKGSIEGLTAAECANNAVIGGAMIPTLTLGIPGDSVTAILLGAMIILGLRPGPTLFTETDPELRRLVAGLFVGLFTANILVFPLRLLGAPLFSRVIALSRQFLWPLVVVFCVIGSYSMTSTMMGTYIMLVFGVFGYVMKKLGFPPGPLILGVILGPIAESNLHRALLISKGHMLGLFSPLAVMLLAAALFSVVFPLIQERRKRNR
ncbi:MAG: C4-dicarboxylate ABC transporter permease [Deltaproteobacteria bacterium]|nr:C4-dicarboxylate ABC transporter permease [Deltaproteobacteria bacterium]